MLVDEPEKMLDLFLENLIRGQISFDFPNFEGDTNALDTAIEDRDKLRDWYKIRKQTPKPDNSEYAIELCDALIHWRAVRLIRGELRDVISEQRIQQLEKEKEELVDIVADQKKKLDGLYVESPDKKNIRGIS